MHAAAAGNEVSSDDEVDTLKGGAVIGKQGAIKPSGNGQLLQFDEDPVINGGRLGVPNHSPSGSGSHQFNNNQATFADSGAAVRRPVSKLPPLETKSQGFDLISGNSLQQQHQQ
jgi:hypothetical protein